MQRKKSRAEYHEGPLLPELRSDPEAPAGPDGDKDFGKRRGKGADWEGRTVDPAANPDELKMDIVEKTADGCLILGNEKTTDRSSILIVPGLNDSAILEMGRLGMLKGRAQDIYEKFSK